MEAKRRGRPKKQEEPERNEMKKEITMTSKTNSTITKTNNTIINTNPNPPRPDVSLLDVQNKWQSLITRYGATQEGMLKLNTTMSSSLIKNPFLQNTRIKESSAQIVDRSKEEIQEALLSPQNNEQLFRETSMLLNFQNYVYNSLLRLNREVPEYHYYFTPLHIRKSEMDNKEFKKEVNFVDSILLSFNPKLRFKTINMQVQQEGKCSYLVRKSYDKAHGKVNFFLLQKLNPDMVKLTGLGSKQQYTVSFNMMIFLNPAYDVSQYPPYIAEIWEEMQKNGMVQKDAKTKALKFYPKGTLNSNHLLEYANNSYYYWVELNQNDCVTFGQDLSTPLVLPETIGMFLDFEELSDYRWLMGSLMSKSVTSILTGTVPMQKDAKAGSDATLVSPDLISLYDSIFARNVSSNVLSYFAPFTDFKLHEIQNQPDNMDIIYDKVRDLIATSGNSALLSVNDKPSIAMTKAAQAISASRAHYLTLQFEQFLNNVINEQFELKHRYKITLWGDIFDKDKIKLAKELLLSGVHSMLPVVLSYFNQSVLDYGSITDFLDVMDIKFKEEELKEEAITPNPVGRPKLEDDEIENDSTGASVDAGTNVSDIKEFKKEEANLCRLCHEELEYGENLICENCLESIL